MHTSIVVPESVDARVGPRGSLEILSQAEIDKLLDTSQTGLHLLFRNCALAVLTSGSDNANAKELFERYRQHRAWSLNPNVVMEAPALFEELGPVSGLRVLDLGCGDAEIGRELLNAGAARYRGIDGSARMVEDARQKLEGTTGEAVSCDIEDLAEPAESFEQLVEQLATVDFVVASRYHNVVLGLLLAKPVVSL